jgi:crotonobetaine/carnitine-CoA ligase
VAAVAAMIWTRPLQDDDGNNPLKALRTGGVPEEIYTDFENRFQLKIHPGYSLTEATLCISAPREGTGPVKPTPGIGIPVEHPDPSIGNEVKIVDEKGIEVARGELGEIIVRNPAVMIGYFKDPEKTAETKRKGWIYTGDLGYQDEDDYFFFIGRKKDIIRRRGELISPAEVESIINAHPKVLDSAVIGVLSGLGTGEEEIKAYVRLKPGDAATPQEIISWCGERLADFKVPRYLEFRTEFPTTSTGKIQKSTLKVEKEDLTEGCYDRQKDSKGHNGIW